MTGPTPANAADILPVVTTGLTGAAAFFATFAYGMAAPASTLWGPVISRGPSSSDGPGASVALTFDDGPRPGTTDRILDDLGAAGVRAAFFVIGRHARRWPDLVRRMHDEGHLVGNHTFDHLHTGLFGRHRYWQAEIARADDAVQEILGVRPAVFRPPMGYKHWHLMNAAVDEGHRVVTWSRRARDTKATASHAILDRLAEPARGGDVIVMHDGDDPCLAPQDRRGTGDAVRPLIATLRRRGLEPIRLDEMLRIRPYQPTRMPVQQPAAPE